MNRIKISHVDELPKTCSVKMWPHQPILSNGDLIISINNTSYIINGIPLEQIHDRYKDFYWTNIYKKRCSERFKDTKQTFYLTGKKGETYEVKQDGSVFSCTCKGFMFRRSCKHVEGVKKELGL